MIVPSRSHAHGRGTPCPAVAFEHNSKHLRASAMTLSSPSTQAWVTIWHMHPTMAAVEALSAPPDRGNKYPEAPTRAARACVSTPHAP